LTFMNTQLSQDSKSLDLDQRKKAWEALNRVFSEYNQRQRGNPPPPPQHATPEAEEAKGQEQERARAKKEEEISPPSPEWIDLVSLAEEPDDPLLDLLGRGFLRRSAAMMMIGPTECGKSSASVQMAVEWACAYEKAIIPTANHQALRVLVIQSEDDRQDAREMARCYKHLGLTPEQIAQVKQNTHFARWRGLWQNRGDTGHRWSRKRNSGR
jgi:hypothetical protein